MMNSDTMKYGKNIQAGKASRAGGKCLNIIVFQGSSGLLSALNS